MKGCGDMKPESPCRDCEKRQLSCHSTCEDYIAFDKAKKAYNEKVSKAKESKSISWTRTTRNAIKGGK